MKVQLYPYQKSIAEVIKDRKNLLIVAPMGSGKTLSTLTAVKELVDDGKIQNILIIAPLRVAKSVWQQENEDKEIGLNVKYCEKGIDVKLFMLDTRYDNHVAVCSVSRIGEIPHGCWDMIICDESTLFKHKSSNRSKEIRRICNKVPYRVLLSGTPIHNGYEGVWHQIFILDGGKAIGKSLTSFRQQYMMEKFKLQGVVSVYAINPHRVDDLKRDISHLVYVVKECVKIPDIFFKEIQIDLPTTRLKEYRTFERESVLRFKEETGFVGDLLGSEKTLRSFATSSRGMKLRQLASGVVYVDEDRKNYSVTHSEKIKALTELSEGGYGNMIVAYNFLCEYEELKRAFPHAVRLETAEDIKRWNAGEIQMVLAHPASMGHGLNLQFGGSIIVWYSPTYDAELYDQLNKRIHRNGQKDTVTIVSLIAKGTIENRVKQTYMDKIETASMFVSNSV